MLFSILLAGFLILSTWWILSVPHQPERLFRSIPAGVAFLSYHKDLGGRWADMAENPVIRNLLVSHGVDLQDIDEVIQDKDLQFWTKRIASRDLLIAYAPALGAGQQPAWIVAGWIGGLSQRIRWMLQTGMLKDYEKKGTYRGRSLWKVQVDELEPTMELWFTLIEGQVLACISSQPGVIRTLIDAYDGWIPSVSYADYMESDEAGPGSSLNLMDQGWVDLVSLYPELGESVPTLSYGFDEIGKQRLSGRLSGSLHLPLPETPIKEFFTSDLSRLFPEPPLGIALGHASTLVNFSEEVKRLPWLIVVREICRSFREQPMALALLNANLENNLTKIRLPSMLLAIHTEGLSGKVRKRVQKALDRLNARYRWGLIPRNVKLGGQDAFTFDSGTKDIFESLLGTQRPYLVQQGPWLLIGTNRRSLQDVVDYAVTPEAAQSNMLPLWAEGVGDVEAVAYCWLDMKHTGQAVRFAMSLYKLKLLVKPSDEAARARERIDQIKMWLEALMPLETFKMWFRADGSKAQCYFKTQVIN